MRTNTPPLLFILIAGCTAAAGFSFAQDVFPAPGPAPLGVQAADADEEEDAPPALTHEEQAWHDRLTREDAAAAARARGYAAAEFPNDSRWARFHGPLLGDLRGKVILVQTFATRGPGRSAVSKLERSIAPLADEEDFKVIAVHVPDGIDRAEKLLPSLNLPESLPILLDTNGTWSDSVGAFKRPVAYLIDRQGNVRYAGVSQRSIEDAARHLLAETYDDSTLPRQRPEPKIESISDAEFPSFGGAVGSATDRRGQGAPAFYVQEFFKPGVADAGGKVVVLDFWATWCAPCRKAIPHMNELQKHFGQKVVCLGISDESKFEEKMLEKKLRYNDFEYGLAVDKTSKLKSWFGIRGIPHVVVLSGDWVVRWQGHPSSLNESLLGAIVTANDHMMNLATKKAAETGPPPARWNQYLTQRSSR